MGEPGPSRLFPLSNVSPHVGRGRVGQGTKLVKDAQSWGDRDVAPVVLEEHTREVLPEESRYESESCKASQTVLHVKVQKIHDGAQRALKTQGN